LASNLDARDTARMFAMVHTAVSDAIIIGFEAKYRYAAWRPRTAIPQADADGNPRTDADPSWRPLLSVNHPEYPSGHSFYSTAVTEAVAQFFGTSEVPWTIVTSKEAVPQLVRTERAYNSLGALMDDVTNARVWFGLHYRNTMREGAEFGGRVARHVLGGYFRPS